MSSAPQSVATINKDQQRILNAFRGQIYVSNQLDVQTGSLWDSIQFTKGQTAVQNIGLFEIPLGQAFPYGGPTKTLTDTNMNKAGRLDAPEAFSVNRIVFTFSKRATDHDIYAFAEAATFTFWMGQKRYLWSPIISLQTLGTPLAPVRICDFCRAVYCGDITCPGCGARQFQLSSLGEEEAGRRFYLDCERLIILDRITFKICLELSAPYIFQNYFKMWCHLEGLHARGVQ
jgi:hypothetical protein